MARAVFFDVDGTLFSHETGRVPDSSREAIARLRSKGILVGVATGRNLWELRYLPMGGIEFDVLLTLNGQLVLDGKGNLIEGNPLSEDGLAHTIRMFEERTHPVLLIEQERMYINYVDEAVVAAQASILTPIPEIGTYGGAAVYQANVYVDEAASGHVRELLAGCDVTRWHEQALDVNAPSEGGKAAGIARYVKGLGIDMSEVVAFGDAENDLPMLRAAGIGVAMGNATPEAKAEADLVTDDIDDDGVAKALRKLGLI